MSLYNCCFTCLPSYSRSSMFMTPVSLGNLQPGTSRAPRESWLAPELARGQTPKPLKHGSQGRLATGLLHESKNLPLRPYQKTGSGNEDIPHEGRRQNRSAVYQTPVSFGQLQPSIVLSFAGNHPTVHAFEGRISSPIPWHAP